MAKVLQKQFYLKTTGTLIKLFVPISPLRATILLSYNLSTN